MFQDLLTTKLLDFDGIKRELSFTAICKLVQNNHPRLVVLPKPDWRPSNGGGQRRQGTRFEGGEDVIVGGFESPSWQTSSHPEMRDGCRSGRRESSVEA